MDKPLYHAGNRELQDRFDSRRIADRLEQVTLHDWFTDDDRDFVERCAMFFLATADAEGQPDVSYKGGLPGFVARADALANRHGERFAVPESLRKRAESAELY